MNRKFSFIIIAYNEERSIGRCIDSILNLDGLDSYEIVVVNDGSKDLTSDVVEDRSKSNSNIKLINLFPNRGRGAARATGVKAATGDLIAFVDADIILPINWLVVCSRYLENSDAVSGLPVPDGDVGYIYSTFGLPPKPAKPSTIINGSNGLYRKEIFSKINFDEKSRDGEDFVINQHLLKENYRLFVIDDLIVDHRETKTFKQSMRWLYQSGKGATRLLKKFKKIRLPDLTFFGFLLVLLITLYVTFEYRLYTAYSMLIFYLTLTSSLHIYSKFYLNSQNIVVFAQAVIVNTALLTSYFTGRLVGLFNREAYSS